MMEGLEQVIKKLDELSKLQDCSVVIEFTGEKDVTLHEDLQTTHTNGQAKFLEQPFRAMKDQIFTVIVETHKKTNNPRSALIAAANIILSKARELYPAEEKIKRISGRVRVEK